MKDLKTIAKACFKCQNAPCIKDCPLHNNIPVIMKYYEQEKYLEAYQIIIENNPLISLCGLICPHEHQCAKNCKHLKAFKERIRIEEIEHDLFLRFGHNFNFPPISKGSVNVVGAGVAGLAASILLRKSGFKVVLCEAENKIGGVIANQIPRFRFDDSVLEDIYNEIKDHIDIRFNTKLGENLTLEDLDNYDFHVIATGSNKPIRILNRENIFSSSWVLSLLKENKFNITNKKIGVLGCGNAAIDTARSLNKIGNDVTIIYRRNLENAPATKHEIECAKTEGVNFKELYSLEEYYEGIATLRKMELLPKVEGERQKFKSTDILENDNFDLLVEAYGANPDFNVFKDLKWFKLIDDKDWLLDSSHLNTYFVGDVYNHPTSIATAIQHAKLMCQKIITNYNEINRIKKDLKGKKIVLGGSFNPPTIAHIEIANFIKKHISKDLLLLPNGNKYPTKELLSFEERLELIKMSFPNIEIDDYEKDIHFGGTVKYLELKDHPFFVIGTDSLRDLVGWIDGKKLIENNKFIVFKRENDNVDEIFEKEILLRNNKSNFYIITISTSNVSSSKFRETFDANYVLDEVYDLIIKNGYYK